jgi:hypothetical protein
VTTPRGSESDENVLAAVDNVVPVSDVEVDGGRRGRGLDLGLDTRLLGDETSERVEVTATLVLLRLGRAGGEPLEGCGLAHFKKNIEDVDPF